VLGVISHILHPHPDINPLSLSSLLKVAVIFSPWVYLEMKVSSVLENRLQDPVSPETMRGWTQDYLGTAPLDNYNQPIIALLEWWHGIPVEELLVRSKNALGGPDQIQRNNEGYRIKKTNLK